MAEKVYFKAREGVFKELAQVAGGSSHVAEYAGRLIEAHLDGKTPEVTPKVAPEVTLAAATAVILRHIDRDQAELILDLCQDNGHQPADYLLGYLELIRDRQETAMLFGQEHVLDSAVSKPVLAKEEYKACEFCTKEFKVERRGQRYCPDPADGVSCGRQAFLKELHERRPPAPVKVKRGADSLKLPDYSPPQVDTVQMQRILAQQQEVARATADG